MRRLALALSGIALLLAAGCEYQVPITDKHVIPVDGQIVGLWAALPGKGHGPKGKERLLVLPYGDTQYIVQYPVGEEAMYFRAYPVKIGERSCVQLELLGSLKGPVPKKERKYHVVAYSLAGDLLQVQILNTELIDPKIRDSEALKNRIQKHKKDPALFRHGAQFRRLAP
ncbi:MAG: hypothetical protein JXR37_30880 [Kiritimatiellae bacterium]|nr:hypothetical protein [Kiritimatiellia bacterium]